MAIKMDDLVALTQALNQQGGTDAQQFLQTLFGLYPNLQSQLAGLQQQGGTLNENQQNVFDQAGAAFPAITLPQFTSEGFTPDAMAALMGGNIDKQSQAFDQQGAMLKASLARRGIFGDGSIPGSGLAVDPLAALAASKATANAQAIRDAILANQNQVFKNRESLSLPFMQLSGNTQQANNAQEIQRRQLLQTALNGGTNLLGTMFGGLNIGTNLGDMLLRGYGAGMGTQQNAIGNLTTQKEAALQNDRSGFGSQFMGALGRGLGQGVAGAVLP